ncbi:patatin-like phospholipase family protein [candidate division WOR-3 bacterium]|nr:patatin-like phospholipase family protein [candidate division WOR-3 bacterium]
MIAGASSGSLNAVALNAILRTEDGESPAKYSYTWDDYKKLLFDLRNSDVYDVSPGGIVRIFTNNIPSGYILNTAPLLKLLKKVIEGKMDFKIMKDLYLPTYISTVDPVTGKEYRFSNRNPQHARLPVVDVLMASCAIPIAFQLRKIKGFSKVRAFIDGGTGRDGIPVEAMRKENCEEIYVISKMRGNKKKEYKTGIAIPVPKLLKNAIQAFEVL